MNDALQQTDKPFLSLQEIADRLGVSYGVVRRFAEAEGVRDFVGAREIPGANGVRYPQESEATFRYLVEAGKQKLVTPGTATAWLRNSHSAPLQQGDNAGSLVPLRQGDKGEMIPILSRIADLLQIGRGEPDRLMTAEQVREFLPGRSDDWLRRHVPSVKDGGRRFWKHSAVQAYIAAL